MIILNNTFLKVIFIVWIVFSIGYICWDLWSDFKFGQLAQIYQQGRVDTINTLIEQVKGCNPVPITSGTNQVQVLNYSCLDSSGALKK